VRDLWPGGADAPPDLVGRYCACLLAKQEARWNLERFTLIWLRVDQGVYENRRGGLFPSAPSRYPGHVLAWMAECKAAVETRPEP
jgi:hypothetical protein